MSSRGANLTLTVIRQPIPLSEVPYKRRHDTSYEEGSNTCEDCLSIFSNLYKNIYTYIIYYEYTRGFTTLLQ